MDSIVLGFVLIDARLSDASTVLTDIVISLGEHIILLIYDGHWNLLCVVKLWCLIIDILCVLG